MKLTEFTDLVATVNDSASIKTAATLIHPYFTVSRFLVYLNKKTTTPSPVQEIRDEFGDILVLKQQAKRILKDYKVLCEKFMANKDITVSEKIAQLLFCRNYFGTSVELHDYDNYFAFTSQDLFYLVGKDGHQSLVDYDKLGLKESQLNSITDFFSVRKQFFQALVTILNLHYNQIELLLFQTAKFKLKKETGTRLLWELVLAMTQDSKYIDLDEIQKPLFEKAVFDFFGLPYKDRGKALHNYLRKGRGYAKELSHLRNVYQQINREDLIKSPRKKPLK